jgi:hypothetical protein
MTPPGRASAPTDAVIPDRKFTAIKLETGG